MDVQSLLARSKRISCSDIRCLGVNKLVSETAFCGKHTDDGSGKPHRLRLCWRHHNLTHVKGSWRRKGSQVNPGKSEGRQI